MIRDPDYFFHFPLDFDIVAQFILSLKGGSMMHELTVTEASRSLGVSTRMLRYCEKEGLISCGHREDYAYRIYDETAVRRLKQILVLRTSAGRRAVSTDRLT